MIASLSLSGIAAMGVIVGVVLSVVAYLAFIAGMSGLAEMGRLAKTQRMELESQHRANDRARRLEDARLEDARLEELLRQQKALSQREASLMPEAEPETPVKVPWWKYEPRRK